MAFVKQNGDMVILVQDWIKGSKPQEEINWSHPRQMKLLDFISEQKIDNTGTIVLLHTLMVKEQFILYRDTENAIAITLKYNLPEKEFY